MKRRPAESVRISVCVVNVMANRSSLQDVTKAKIAVAAMPGAASGSTMRHSAPKAAAVDERALLQVARDRVEVPDQHPDRERHREGEVRVDERLVGVDEAEGVPL